MDMPRPERWKGVLLTAAVVVWGTSGAVFAKGTNHGRGHANGVTKHATSTSTGGTTTHSSGGSSPTGNNGTVKIDNYNDRNGNDTAHNNEPHVTCRFGVDAYGYESAVIVGHESFRQHSPTNGGHTQHRMLTDRHSRGTGATYNGANSVSLSLMGRPHPKQGFHEKLTYLAVDSNSQGSTLKHKVFWLRACASTASVTPGARGSIVSQALGHIVANAAAARAARPSAATPGFTG